jgi:ATP-binding cassette, subfamily B, bacterial
MTARGHYHALYTQQFRSEQVEHLLDVGVVGS